MSGTSWISEMGLEDPSYSDQYDILDFFDEDLSAAIVNIGEEDMHQNSWSQDFMNNNNSSSSNAILIPRTNSTTSLATSSSSTILLDAQNIAGLDETPLYCHNNFDMNNNLINAENINTSTTVVVTPSPSILVFGNSNEPALNIDGVANEVLITSSGSYVNMEEAAKRAQQSTTTTKKTTRTRPPSQTYDHIIAERKRREQLSQQFVALSTIVPGLKKMDKTSVLGDAINYLKQLQEKVKTLEEKASNQKMESMVLVKKTKLLIEEEGSSINSDDQQGGTYDEQHLPNIEAKLCDKKVLLRIQCEKNKGVLGKIFSVIQMLNMAVINTNVTPFGNMALDITIVAELDKELNLTMKELVKSLRSALLLE
uniref:BHLH1 n=1 Tax=Gentiana crassa subsp. rigescens TaxID=3097545 RepID=A0A0A7CC64_9GENT|nr:bHLH1 [Gentiana rigescens]